MLILIALALLFLLTIAIAVLSWRRETALPHPYYLGAGMLAVMILIWLGRPRQPFRIPWIRWQAAEIIPVQPTFLIDEQSWLFSLALLAVAVGFVLNVRKVDRQSVWILGLTSAGLLGTLSGNALSLLFSWTLIDLLHFGYQVQHRPSRVALDRFVFSFSYRLAAPVLLTYGSFHSLRMGIPLTFQIFSPRVGWILFAAAIARIVLSLPLASEHDSKTAQNRHLLFSQSVTVAVGLLLLSRVAEGGLAPPGIDRLRLWIALVLPLFSLGWITAPDPFSGVRSWMLGWLSLVSLAVVEGHGGATLAWSLTWLLSGNILFLVPRSAELNKYIALLFLLGAGGLPLTPLWKGMILFSDGLRGVYWAVCFGIFLLGGIRFVLGAEEHGAPPDDGFPVQPAVVLVFLVLAHEFLAYEAGLFPESLSFTSLGWGVLVPYGVLIPGIVWGNSLTPGPWLSGVKAGLSSMAGRGQLLVLTAGRRLSRLIMGTFRVLEGRGGLIWALLGVFFLLSVLASAGGG